MKYEVHTVADDALPPGIDRVIVERTEGPPLLIICGVPARVWAFMRAWEDTIEPPAAPTLLYAV